MNKRLLKIADKVNDGIGLADIGTDHGYLPVYLLQHGYTGNIFASDINSGPLEVAKEHALQAGVEEKISFLLCDGLALCPPEKIDTIVVAGMGGDLISHILSQASWCHCSGYKFILQPMTKQENLRAWLNHNNFAIEEEDLVKEGRVYQIITARYGGVIESLNAAERLCGRYELIKDNPLFPEYLQGTIKRYERISSGQKRSSCCESTEDTTQILRQLQEMRLRYYESL